MACNTSSTTLPSVATNGADGKTVLNGAGAPASSLGTNGDFYIDTTADAIYGPKTAGAWGSATSLIGAAGSSTTGAAGADGVAIICNNLVIDTPHSGALATLKSFTVPADTLTDTGDAALLACDAIEVLATFTLTGTLGVKQIKVLINTTDLTPSLTNSLIQTPVGASSATLKMTISRRSATTVAVSYQWSISAANGVAWFPGSFSEVSIAAANLTTLTNLIDVRGFTTGPDTIVCNQLLIKSLKA